jgi:hypothetical protein
MLARAILVTSKRVRSSVIAANTIRVDRNNTQQRKRYFVEIALRVVLTMKYLFTFPKIRNRLKVAASDKHP